MGLSSSCFYRVWTEIFLLKLCKKNQDSVWFLSKFCDFCLTHLICGNIHTCILWYYTYDHVHILPPRWICMYLCVKMYVLHVSVRIYFFLFNAYMQIHANTYNTDTNKQKGDTYTYIMIHTDKCIYWYTYTEWYTYDIPWICTDAYAYFLWATRDLSWTLDRM